MRRPFESSLQCSPFVRQFAIGESATASIFRDALCRNYRGSSDNSWAFRLPLARAMTRARRALRLLAETVREIGILMVVFAPLESVFADRRIDAQVLMAVVAAGVALIACGILVETKE
jgi:hypothetical protein